VDAVSLDRMYLGALCIGADEVEVLLNDGRRLRITRADVPLVEAALASLWQDRMAIAPGILTHAEAAAELGMDCLPAPERRASPLADLVRRCGRAVLSLGRTARARRGRK
jgi:hypothetical protein